MSLKYQKSIRLNFIFRLCGISSSVFFHSKNQVLFPCQSSPMKLCRRIYPNQLTGKEINTMKLLLCDDRFRYWPIISIAYYALRNNTINVSLSSWYNYSKKLGMSRPRVRKKKGYPTGIRTTEPHQVWHADITVVKCINGLKCYVYLVMDNYSRAILNYQVSERVSSKMKYASRSLLPEKIFASLTQWWKPKIRSSNTIICSNMHVRTSRILENFLPGSFLTTNILGHTIH